jgi:hypothetical protein
MNSSSNHASLARVPRQIEPWRNPDWQQLWLSAQSPPKAWRTLALLPAGPGASPEVMMQIAVSLAHTGMTHLGVPIQVADATRITLGQLVHFTEELNYYERQDAMVLLALSALSENVTSTSLAQSADRTLLCVLMDTMSAADAKKTVERLGKDRFIGSALFRFRDS